jgi:thiamine biosynthesis lipoprotein
VKQRAAGLPLVSLSRVVSTWTFGLMAAMGCANQDASPRASEPPMMVPTSSSGADGSADAVVLSVGAAADAAVAPAFVPVRVSHEARAMGTHVAFTGFTTPALDEAAVQAAFESAVVEIQRIEALMTTWQPDSELSRVNAAAGKNPVVVGDETFAVIAEALHTSAISEGTFDITFEGLHGLWKFDEDLDPHPPTAAQVKARLPYIGYKHVHLDNEKHTVYLDRVGVKISLGGIAKGYGIDKAVAVLDKAGLTSFYAQAGGDLFARGVKPDGSAWSAGVRDPRGDSAAYFAILPVTDHAFSTAGDYERTYFVKGKRYHHIIDPRTGYPATASRSVTIYAPTALQADAIDDAVFILGPEKGLTLVDSLPDVGAVIVDAKNRTFISSRLKGKLWMKQYPTDAP